MHSNNKTKTGSGYRAPLIRVVRTAPSGSLCTSSPLNSNTDIEDLSVGDPFNNWVS